MKTEVYSWRVSADLKTGLEHEARRRKISVSCILDLAAREWLNQRKAEQADEQLRLQEAAGKYLGCLDSGDSQRSENARDVIRKRLRRRRGI